MNAGFELFRIDLASAAASLVRDLHPGAHSYPDWLTALGTTLFFTALDPAFGRELFKTDGSFAGTVLVRDIAAGPAHSNPRHLTAHGGKLYFSADDGVTGRELWVSDGTAGGTLPVRDIFPGLAGSSPLGLFSAGPWLYFSAYHPDSGVGLWRSDGTEAGTLLLAHLGAGDSGGLTATILDPFLTTQPAFGYFDLERFLMTQAAGAAPYAAQTEFVRADDGRVAFRGCQRSVGCQLWVTDGSAEGTVRLTDFGPAPGGASPGHLMAIGNTVYFAATDESDQRELWKIELPLGEAVFANGFENM
ncbi:MAG TPA: hypothetical protein PKZ76_02585 [Xanthomonadaceae bacterium]|nr:hypothetical protein [Xanthomonadaceae bacterium]